MTTGIWSYEWALDNSLIFLTSIHITKTHYQCTGPDKPYFLKYRLLPKVDIGKPASCLSFHSISMSPKPPEICYAFFFSGQIGFEVNVPFTFLMIPNGLSFCNSAGSMDCGQFWKQTGRTHRIMADVPTEVNLLSVVAGKGPP